MELWSHKRGLERISAAYPPSFYMRLKDPRAHWEMIEGHRIYASQKVAEKIEIQTRYAAELYNVDVRQDQRYLAEKDLSEDYQENNSPLSLCLQHH